MKNFIRIGLFLIFSIALMQPVSGQRLLKNLKEKMQEKIDEKIEQEANEKIDEKIDEKLEIEESDSKSQDAKSQQRMMGMLKGMGISGEPIPIADKYTFDSKIQMHIESFDESGKKTSDGEFITLLNAGSNCMAYQVVSGDISKSGQGMFIMDAENKATIILSEEDGKKTGLVYGIGSFLESMGDEYEDDANLEETPETYLANPNVKKTGKTKTIAGYKCEQYTYSDEESDAEYWITKDLKTNSQDFLSTLFKTSVATNGMGWGYLMEASSTDKESGTKSIMKVTDVNAHTNVKFSMGDYQITNFGNITIPQE